ncbi:hypothetical protein [Microcoleus sp. D2_18a_D3]|uniref:hypothetical protein n=1 Tax=Microcoleus sp. D2_18a_D3 TaxID=3055330 RepID=UPI002FD3BDE0
MDKFKRRVRRAALGVVKNEFLSQNSETLSYVMSDNLGILNFCDRRYSIGRFVSQ